MEIQLYDNDSEQAILGGICVNSAVLKDIQGEVTPSDFDERHQAIYRAILKISDRGDLSGLDLVMLLDELKKAKNLERAGGVNYVSSLWDAVSTTAGIKYHIKKVKDATARRAILELSDDIKEDLKSQTPPEDIIVKLRDTAQKLSLGGHLGIDPYEPLAKSLADKYERDMARDPKKLLGYKLKKFKKLATNIDGVQPGFYLIGAVTSVGKTSLLANLTLDLLDSNEDLAGIYFSLDDSKNTVINRFLGINTGLSVNDVQKPQMAADVIFNKGYSPLTDLAVKNRLFIRDASDLQSVDELKTEIKRRMDKNLFVVIDGLYNLGVAAGTVDQTQENIERANELKAISDIYNIPVICTGELRKSKSVAGTAKEPVIDDILSTVKFAYNANLILLLYPDDWDEYDTADKALLKLKYAKNKLSDYRKEGTLRFHKMTSFIEEWSSMGE